MNKKNIVMELLDVIVNLIQLINTMYNIKELIDAPIKYKNFDQINFPL